MAPILATSTLNTNLDLHWLSWASDKGEDAVVLSALASSNSLSTITHFRCSHNESWFSEDREGNVELISDAIRAMTNLKYFSLETSQFLVLNLGLSFYCSALCPSLAYPW